MSVLDIIVIAILFIFAIVGFVKGFLNSILSLFGNLASLALAIVIVEPCAKFFDKLFHLVDWLGGLIIKGISHILPDIAAVGGSMSGEAVVTELNGHDLLGKLVALFVDKSATYGTGEGMLDLSVELSKKMGAFATTVFTVIIMFILIRIGILILSKVFDAITKKRALSGLDRLLGFVLGAVKGAIFVSVGLIILHTLSTLIPGIQDMISASKFTNWLYGYINQLIQWFLNSIDLTKIIGTIGLH